MSARVTTWQPDRRQAVAQDLPLVLEQAGRPLDRQVEHRVHLVEGERVLLGGPLDLDEAPGVGAHDVHVDVGLRVLDVVEVEAGQAADDADRGRGDETAQRRPVEEALGAQRRERVRQGDEGAGDRGAAGAAVRLDDIAVDPRGARPERGHVDHGAQGPADETLDLLGPARRPAAGRLAGHALAGGARDHAVLAGDPPLIGVAQEPRHAVLDARRADDVGVPHLDERRSLGVDVDARRDLHRAQVAFLPAVQPFHRHSSRSTSSRRPSRRPRKRAPTSWNRSDESVTKK
jgi:hypothetical protein